MHERKGTRGTAPGMMVIDVQVRQPRYDYPVYSWDAERGRLRLSALSSAEPGLPADLAFFPVEGGENLPVLLLCSQSTPPGTLVRARLLGALSNTTSTGGTTPELPSGGWVLVAAAEVDTSLSPYSSIEALPPPQLYALQAYVQQQASEDWQPGTGRVQSLDAAAAASLLRETRLALKRLQRAQAKGKGWLTREQQEEKPVAWRAIQGLSETLRAQMQQHALLREHAEVPHAHAEQLIRFAPQRFQHALADLLLDDERLLFFLERPLLRHRTGWLGIQSWRSNEGLFLITDRQVLWLRDFLAPGKALLQGGYIAHAAPLERLSDIGLLPAGKAPIEFAGRLEESDSPYARLVMELKSKKGSELFVIEFPPSGETEKALARAGGILRAFLPLAEGGEDRRVRRLPVVETWVPIGAEAERLAGLGGSVPPTVAKRLEQGLSRVERADGEDVLVSALVPALEEYKSPARLIALTRSALLVMEDFDGGSPRRAVHGQTREQGERLLRFPLENVSSAQLSHSLLGASLSIFVPQQGLGERALRHVFPFHSPAIAWFVPLFTRLRLLLGMPYCIEERAAI